MMRGRTLRGIRQSLAHSRAMRLAVGLLTLSLLIPPNSASPPNSLIYGGGVNTCSSVGVSLLFATANFSASNSFENFLPRSISDSFVVLTYLLPRSSTEDCDQCESNWELQGPTCTDGTQPVLVSNCSDSDPSCNQPKPFAAANRVASPEAMCSSPAILAIVTTGRLNSANLVDNQEISTSAPW